MTPLVSIHFFVLLKIFGHAFPVLTNCTTRDLEYYFLTVIVQSVFNTRKNISNWIYSKSGEYAGKYIIAALINSKSIFISEQW